MADSIERSHSTAATSAQGFDEHHAPDREIIADCVHCGFCLPTCPTFLLWGEEMDSPRGRIQLMKMVSDGEVPMTETVARHWDQCLGCMACVTACPSGVRYDALIEATRAQRERRVVRSVGDRLFREMLFALFPYPERLRAFLPAFWLYQRTGAARLLRLPFVQKITPERLRTMETVLPPVRLGSDARLASYVPAKGTPRLRVGMLRGCVQRVFFDDVNAATARVLSAEGCEVVIPATQGCCGALSMHAGREEEGLAFARRLIDVFEAAEVDVIAVNVAGCGSNLKDYGRLLRDDVNYAERAAAFSAKVRDISEVLADLEPRAPRSPIAARIAYHDACHLAHAQGIRKQPRSVLTSIPGIELVNIPEAEICCGSAGIYNLTEPEPAAELGERKARHILSTQPDALVAANPGCLLQITASLRALGADIPTLHPIELLDASIRGTVPPALARKTRERAAATVGAAQRA